MGWFLPSIYVSMRRGDLHQFLPPALGNAALGDSMAYCEGGNQRSPNKRGEMTKMDPLASGRWHPNQFKNQC